MKATLLLAVLTTVFAACSVLSGFENRYMSTQATPGPRFDLAPGDTVEVPFRLVASGTGDAEVRVELAPVSHDTNAWAGLSVSLEVGSGDVESDPEQPQRVGCVGDCRGDHLLSVSLEEEAQAGVTVNTSVVANLYSDDRHENRPIVEIESIDVVDNWAVAFDPEGMSTGGNVGRLHVTAPVDASGGLRLEVPGMPGFEDAHPLLVDDSREAVWPTPGSSLPLVAPDRACGPRWCDWSVMVAAVTSWRVAASSDEFAVSFQPIEGGGTVSGQTTWNGTIAAGEVVELTLEVTSPDIDGTDIALSAFVGSNRGNQTGYLPETVDVLLGSHEIPHDRHSPLASTVLVGMSCSNGSCRGSVPVSIDARDHDEELVIRLDLQASVAASQPVSGAIQFEVVE